MSNTDITYSSIFIPKRVTICTRPSDHICYISDSENKKTLETARLATSNYKSRDAAESECEYENGHFKVKILRSAVNSSQGGKLSFWFVELKAPDGKMFKVGINAEILCELLQFTTFVNGECQEDVYFGTQHNQYGLYTKSMPSYTAFINSQALRESMKETQSTKYKPGDMVRSLTESKVYLGEVYKYFDYEGNIWCGDLSRVKIIVYKQPIKMHAFAEKLNNKWYIWDSSMLKKKPKRIFVESGYDYNEIFDDHLAAIKADFEEYVTSNSYSFGITNCIGYLRYGREAKLPDDLRSTIYSNIKQRIDIINSSRDFRYPNYYNTIQIEEI